MKRILRLICLLLCAAMIPLYAVAETAPEASAPNIRVLLRRLALTDRADLTLDGVYTAASGDVSMAFPRGSEVTVQIREGRLYLFYAGLSLKLGTSLRLTRNATENQALTGLRFERNGNLYPGDLLLTIDGGALRPVLTLSIEDYLQGVVPYEMSDSFPLEALKAQAVCARTYALAKVDASRDYDVVDTTNDQVFRGIDPSYQNAIRAVKETAGVVGTYNGNLATCYYSASNGGQTELVGNVWTGGGDWSYYAMTDDPYDLENPESIVRRATLRKDASGLKDAFVSLIAGKMTGEMRKQGFVAEADCFRLDSITDVSLGGQKFAEPSRYVTKLTLTFTWSGRRQAAAAESRSPFVVDDDEEISLFSTASPTVDPTAAPTATPAPTSAYSEFIPAGEPTTLTLNLFPEVVRALNLSISGTNNEMISLATKDDAFVLESRRYGHGVGMSQRGAQWMAGQYGKQFHEILAFYYPGMVLMRAQAGDPVLPTAPAALAATPAPPATPTPRPTLMPVTTDNLPEGAWVAFVTNIEDNSSLNLRAEPSQASEILMRLYKNQRLIVLETCEDPAWAYVKTDVTEGYVMVSFLEAVSATE
ncbi:MAG: SpoIID/LytB domain-containing protein [Christensenellaceae bacterium]|nr:SpoIID/LytB domain-containing protein [Christensenellaceae bacterium]